LRFVETLDKGIAQKKIPYFFEKDLQLIEKNTTLSLV
jgi:hypothetical protein